MSDNSSENHTSETIVVHKSNPLYKLGFWLLFILLVLAAVAFGAYWYAQQPDQPQVALNLKSPSPTPQPSTSAVPSPTSSPSQTPSPSPASPPVVVIESQGSIPAADLTQLNNRIVNPIVDYYKEHPGEGPVVSLTISPSDKPTKNEFPYLGSLVFKNGGNSGFVIGKQNGEISWWSPECIKCTFSAEYRSKYPEVVKNR